LAKVRADGLVADNTSAAIAIVQTSDGAHELTLSTTNGTTLFDFDPNFLTTSPAAGAQSIVIPAGKMCHIGDAYYAAAWVQAPLGATPPSYTDKIVVTARQGGQTTSSPAIELVPPPVVLVHGLWSDNTTVGKIASYLQSVLPWSKHRDLIESVCYSKYLGFDSENDPLSASSFKPCEQTSRDALSSIVHELLTILDSKHIVGSRVDIVAHSMGGLAARWAASQVQCAKWTTSRDQCKELAYRYLRNRGKGEFHKIVTLDTPELGSELARFLVAHSGDLFSSNVIVPLIGLPREVGALVKPVELYFSVIDPKTGHVFSSIIGFLNKKIVCSIGQTVAQCFANDPPDLPIAAPGASLATGAVYSLMPRGPSLSNSKLVPPNIPDVQWYAAGSVAPYNSKLARLLDNFIAGISPPSSTGQPVPTVNSILGAPLGKSNDAVVNIPSQLPAAQAYLSRTFPDLSHTQLPILKTSKPELPDANVVESNDVHIFVRCWLSGICSTDTPPIAPRPIPSNNRDVDVLLAALEGPCAFDSGLEFHAHRSPVTGVRLDLANPSLRLHPWADARTIPGHAPTFPGPLTLGSSFVSYSVAPAVGLPVVSLDKKTGILTGLQPGTATVTGQCGSQTDTITVQVGSEQPMPASSN
jgi:hypothetical protein